MNQRFYSLDVFRGATVCLMILVNNPGSWSHIYPPMEHAPWHGLTPTDLVFPFFLFAVGNALSFVMPRLEAGGDAAFWKKVIKRTALIFLIGLFLNWWPFVRWTDGSLSFIHWVNPADETKGVRILGVLQRIALCYFFASIIIYYFKIRKAFFIALLLLLVYWLLCVICNPADPFSIAGWFGTDIDKKILGVIRPMAEYVVENSKTGQIGVVGTRATVNSKSYEIELKNLRPDVQVHSTACPLLVPLIEEGWSGKPETRMILKKYLRKLKTCNIDTLILGCTHYPHLLEDFQRIMGKNVQIPHPGEVVAVSLKSYLQRHPEIETKLNKKSSVRFLTTDSAEKFVQIGSEFLGSKLQKAEKIDLAV